jgi:predicted esterase
MKLHLNFLTKLSLTLAFCLTITLAQAQQPAAARGAGAGQRIGSLSNPRILDRTYQFTNTSETMPFALFVSSKVTKDKKAPLIVALHGMGGNTRSLMNRTATELAEEGGYILVCPMGYNPNGWYGMPANIGGGRGARGATGARGAQGGTIETNQTKIQQLSEIDVLNVLDIIRKEYNVDDRRTYLMGHSMGGGGTLFLGQKYGTNWAAIAAMAPAAFGFQPDTLAKIKDVPVFIAQGADDTLISPAMTERWVDKLKQLNMTYEYKKIPGADHGTVITNALPDIFKFFAKHSKPEPK